MISIGDGNLGLGLGLGFGGGAKMKEAEFEEGETCFHQNYDGDDDNDDNYIDPDIALSYIDEKLQNVLGHFQKDFEGEVSAENLGSKFGGYGSFLPSYHRSPVRQRPRTPQKIHRSNSPRSLYNRQLERVQTNSPVPSSASLLPSRGSTSATVASTHLLKDTVDDFPKRNERMSSAQFADEPSSVYETNKNFPQASERSLRVRIKVGSDNLPTRKNAEIYSGLGLDISPSVSADESPIGSEVSREPFKPPEESPTNILQIMTSFPVHGSEMLSPLPNDLIYLSEKPTVQVKSKCRSSQHVSNASNASNAKHNGRVKGGKHKFSRKNDFPFELKDHVNKDSQNANDLLLKKENNVVRLADEGLVEDSGVGNKAKRECSSDLEKREALEEGSTCDIGSIDLPSERSGMGFEEQKHNSSNNMIAYPRKDSYLEREIIEASAAGSDVCYGEDVRSTGLIDQCEVNATSPEEDYSAFVNKKKPKGSRSQGRKSEHAINVLPKTEVEDSKPQKDLVKVRDTYKDFFGDMELENDDNNVDSEDRKGTSQEYRLAKISNDKTKDFRVVEKSASKIMSKESPYGKKREKPSIPDGNSKAGPTEAATTGSGLISETVAGTGALVPLVKEYWVCCDKCQKWRLLPLGTNPDNLPEKWLCSMLDWLPGMNRCSFSEEETTKALVASHQLPTHGGGQHRSSSVDASMFDRKKGNGGKDVSTSSNQDGPAFNSVKKALVKNSSFNGVNQSPRVNEIGTQCLSKSSAFEKNRRKQKENKKLFEQHSGKREAEPGRPGVSKKAKFVDDRIHDQDRTLGKVGDTSLSGLPLTESGKNLQKKDNHLKRDRNRDTDNKSKDPSRNSHVQNTERKRKKCGSPLLHRSDLQEAASENDDKKGKKAMISKSVVGKQSSGSKGSDGSKKLRITKDKFFEPDLGVESLKRDLGSVQHSQATSSSSKVSGSNKNRTTISREVKGSPVESVSSSPLRFVNQDKSVSMKSLDGKDNFGDVALFTTSSPRRCSDGEDERGSDGKSGQIAGSEVANHRFTDDDTDVKHTGNQQLPKSQNLYQSVTEEQRNEKQSQTDVSCSKKSQKSFASRSKSKNRTSQTHHADGELQTLNSCDESVEHTPSDEKRSLKKCAQEQVGNGFPVVEQVLLKGKDEAKCVAENGRKPELKNVAEISSKKLLSQEMPLSGGGQSETRKIPLHSVYGFQKENEAQSSIADATVGDNTLKALEPTRRREQQSGNHPTKSTNLTPNGRNVKDVKSPSPVRRDSSSQAGNIAVKEAKDLKHLADRLKNSGSIAESTSLYFQAALKFLQGASLLESCSSESAKKGDMIMSMQVYSSTAKLCGFCAHEYEKCKDFAAAALAYKLMEVAHLKVTYSSNTNASKDRHELQAALQIVPLGESPSSSVSDVDNLNNSAVLDKAPLVTGLGSPQVIGNNVITARNRPNLARMLNFAQDVNYAMEASRKSKNAFVAATARSKESQGREGIKSVKKALDFNFQDVERLLRLVRLAMDAISR